MVGASQLCAIPILASGVRHVANGITDSGRTDQRPSREHRHLFRWYRPTGRVYFDEARTNVYKLFRATRVGPDTNIDPARQLAFYDPGLGTQPSDGSSVTRVYRTIYNFVSQATGLGITRNIIDCYAAIIDLWRPGDRIYLFGFSRGAYTVRCLASVLCYCGIPSRGKNDSPLRRGTSATSKIAAEAVKGVYQHVSFKPGCAVFRAAQGIGREVS
jgi:hypothetical protein